uniref:60S ribosomal protein L13 n=1 Tax=Megaselia scalaris TaxID=36166 RepID=T1GBR7_MEGSC
MGKSRNIEANVSPSTRRKFTEKRKLATQHVGPIMPGEKKVPTIEFSEIIKDEKKATLRAARHYAHLVGIRAKRAKEAADSVENG